MWLSHFKDRALGESARLFLNHKFKALGKMTTLHLDTAAHRLEISAELVGETDPIQAKVSYRLEEIDGGLTLVPLTVECSKPWIELLAAQMLADGAIRVPIPAGMATTLTKMLRV